MELENFSALIEIQSIDNYIKKHLDQISEHEKRINFLNKNQEIKKSEMSSLIDEINNLKLHLSKLEKELASNETKLKRAIENSQLASNEKEANALIKEIEILQPLVNHQEEEAFNLLEQTDQLEETKNQLETFIKGSTETINTIQEEVNADIASEQKEIDQYEQRIQLLLNSIPKLYQQTYIAARKKHRFNTPGTYLSATGCMTCRYQIEKEIIAKVESAQAIEVCPGCERVLLPQTKRS